MDPGPETSCVLWIGMVIFLLILCLFLIIIIAGFKIQVPVSVLYTCLGFFVLVSLSPIVCGRIPVWYSRHLQRALAQRTNQHLPQFPNGTMLLPPTSHARNRTSQPENATGEPQPPPYHEVARPPPFDGVIRLPPPEQLMYDSTWSLPPKYTSHECLVDNRDESTSRTPQNESGQEAPPSYTSQPNLTQLYDNGALAQSQRLHSQTPQQETLDGHLQDLENSEASAGNLSVRPCTATYSDGSSQHLSQQQNNDQSNNGSVKLRRRPSKQPVHVNLPEPQIEAPSNQSMRNPTHAEYNLSLQLNNQIVRYHPRSQQAIAELLVQDDLTEEDSDLETAASGQAARLPIQNDNQPRENMSQNNTSA